MKIGLFMRIIWWFQAGLRCYENEVEDVFQSVGDELQGALGLPKNASRDRAEAEARAKEQQELIQQRQNRERALALREEAETTRKLRAIRQARAGGGSRRQLLFGGGGSSTATAGSSATLGG